MAAIRALASRVHSTKHTAQNTQHTAHSTHPQRNLNPLIDLRQHILEFGQRIVALDAIGDAQRFSGAAGRDLGGLCPQKKHKKEWDELEEMRREEYELTEKINGCEIGS